MPRNSFCRFPGVGAQRQPWASDANDGPYAEGVGQFQPTVGAQRQPWASDYNDGPYAEGVGQFQPTVGAQRQP